MLDAVKHDLRSHSYDKNLRGFDLEAKIKAAAERIDSTTSNNQINRYFSRALARPGRGLAQAGQSPLEAG